MAEFHKRYVISEGKDFLWQLYNFVNDQVTALGGSKVIDFAQSAGKDVIFIDTWARFSGRSGGWAEFVIDPRDGQGKDVRADDGFHLNVAGAEILALDIAVAVQDELRALGANI